MSKSALTIQDPGRPGITLLDAIAQAADGAREGGGVFAFASAAGARALLDETAMATLTTKGRFELVVGTDAVTDENAVGALRDYEGRRRGLRIRAVVHDLAGLFHPKYCWFTHEWGTQLLIGSGNLTGGGLYGNVEAFVSVRLEPPSDEAALQVLKDWLERWEDRLLALDAPEVLERVKANTGTERSVRIIRASRTRRGEDEGPPDIAPDAEILVAEIPRNAPLRTQMDVGADLFRDFFGGVAGMHKRIVIQHVRADGTLDDEEPPRTLFGTKSRNYRFEAGAGAGVEYPGEGRPIGLFVHAPDGVFRYHLMWPGDPGHAEVEALLTATSGRGGVRRQLHSLEVVAEAWPAVPLGRLTR